MVDASVHAKDVSDGDTLVALALLGLARSTGRGRATRAVNRALIRS
jgi:hypothetical protein